MAAVARSFLRSSGSSSLRSAAARAASRAGPVPLPRRIPSSGPRVLLRSPVDINSVCLESLMPMHSATASALMTSLLAAPACKGLGWLSEGQMDDLSLLETCSDGIWSGLCNTS
ncbi:hypothetical protein ZEAMMB73_Zm00001d043429 [Zea mays]|uniref:Protein NUCLEAR FUSION DEFECTIVE 6 chloroplastic/mitochondrial n=1 Tax=Zea mays TaxID=4577 RepID=A0A1D6NBQ5_MAIZE|nr:hypothetical protein ZEAMMB73_Zm00001d043429 [Zea mays]